MPEFDVVLNRDDYLKHSKQTHEILKDIERIKPAVGNKPMHVNFL